MDKVYIAIDLKSFYASVECVERGLNPLTTNLVVADKSRTEKTICLAVSPSLKAYGISGRARLFEVVQRVREVNAMRRANTPKQTLHGSSSNADELQENAALALDYIIAPPQMAHYMNVSTKIYEIYLKYVAPEDIHVYSIDEVFIDATAYLHICGLTPRQFAMKLIRDVLDTTGITATAGIGTNLYLAKIAMDIEAKHIPADKDGVRIAELDEMGYRQKLWTHRPLTDFWRIGKGYSQKLESKGLFTMGDIARASVSNEDMLYRMFGVNAELLIDHAWGWEPCSIKEIRAYKPENCSISSGQVLQKPYSFEKGKLIAREMTDLLVLDLVEKHLVCDQMILTVGYDIENLTDKKRQKAYSGEIKTDRYGRKTPKEAHGSVNLPQYTSSTKTIITAVTELYEKIVDKDLTIRRMYVVANHVLSEDAAKDKENPVQFDMFTNYETAQQQITAEQNRLSKEKSMQKAMIDIKKRYGKNAVLKGMNFLEDATTRKRNEQVGGHKA